MGKLWRRPRVVERAAEALLDVEHDGSWYEGWGERPPNGATALDTARHPPVSGRWGTGVAVATGGC